MTRGNQREKAREKNLKKQQQTAKSKKSPGDGNKTNELTSRKERDADIMRQKQQKALEKKQSDSGGAAGGSSK
ncbi:small EDRK-rich factor 2-like [Tubulanus polymorphus]|uniref:small EDRK-rich factor 2-like n=1 Tax=Tubulanus polymorphus TaxID=672921 RepID=UPI003DA5D010